MADHRNSPRLTRPSQDHLTVRRLFGSSFPGEHPSPGRKEQSDSISVIGSVISKS
jgi:hypothetical protein